jgi:hypothetical protein
MNMAPETLVFTTMADTPLGGDDVLVQRATTGGTAVFLQITQNGAFNATAAAFLSIDEARTLHAQLEQLIVDAQLSRIRFTEVPA